MHGIDLNPGGWRAHGILASTDTLPGQAERDAVWDQCQHAGWYFLPWHRGYVAAFEAIVAQVIRDIGGPADWALPYWNYLNTADANARRFPQPFIEPQLPDGQSNPLAWWARNSTQSLSPFLTVDDITLDAMGRHTFTGAPEQGFFGGASTGFAQFGVDGGAGAMELDPHNILHVMVGSIGGFMSDPDYAALDPLFWLHHCNIDRLWAAWLTQSENTQENAADWRDGPTPHQFQMPQPDGSLVLLLPSETLPGGTLAPAYDDLYIGTGVAPPVPAAPAVAGASPEELAMPARLSTAAAPAPRLLGSNQQALTIGTTPRATRVAIAAQPQSAGAAPERVFVFLENIQGAAPSSALSVYVGLPPGARAPGSPPTRVKTVTLFGLRKASQATASGNAGNGMSVAVDITDRFRGLAAEFGATPAELEVHIEQPGPLRGSTITVGKVSIMTQLDS